MAASYQATLANVYPGAWEVAYAAKAWLSTATARWAAARGLGLDVVSGGELAIALHGGFPAERIHFHGNNKTPAELAAALAADVGRIVVDHAGELALLNELAAGQGRRQAIWLRVNPDVDVDTHGHTRTGHATSKFGLALADGTAEAVARQALAMPGVALLGLHCHVGSQFREAAPLVLAVQRLLDLAARLLAATGWRLAELSPGGGWAVPYHRDQVAGAARHRASTWRLVARPWSMAAGRTACRCPGWCWSRDAAWWRARAWRSTPSAQSSRPAASPTSSSTAAWPTTRGRPCTTPATRALLANRLSDEPAAARTRRRPLLRDR